MQRELIPSDRGKGWTKVMFFDHSAIILPSGIHSKDNEMIWVQTVQQRGAFWPHELIQAMGEGIEQLGELKNA